MRTSGIYKIENKINGKYYIGSSNFIERRWRDHKKMLRGNKHYNRFLQNSWNKYGETNFNFIIIENLQENELISREQQIFDKIKTDKNCYNLSFIAGKIEMTDDVRKKISDKHKGLHHTEETKRKLHFINVGKYIGNKNPMYGKVGPNLGKKQSEETKKKIGKIHKGKIVSIETREKIRNSLIGKKQSEETKKKRIESLKKFYNNLENRKKHGNKIRESYKNMSWEDRQKFKEKIKKSWITRKFNNKKENL